MDNEMLKGLAIKSEIVRNYTLVVALLVASACAIYSIWPTTVEETAGGGIPVIDLEAFVRNDVSCKDGIAVVAIQTGDSTKPIYFKSISAQAEGREQSTPITCEQGEYRLDGANLSVRELGEHALNSAQRKDNHRPRLES